ncbi:MAG TPA: crosslink repair DNA glycosylase YcaQ family protein [Ilumatobacteraceae bacterium]
MASPSSSDLSLSAVRRIALAAQGLADPRPRGRIDRRHLRRVLDRTGLIQIDSVNVLVRSQELPLFARLGAHPRTLIPAAAAAGELFEYWGHEASHIPVEHHYLYRWKMEAAKRGATWGGLTRLDRERPGFVDEILRRVEQDGPVVAGDLSQRIGPKGTWWDWDDGKRALEYLFWTGRLTARRRTNDFARVYDLPERMLPRHALERPTPSEPDARKGLLLQAAKAMGVATTRDLAQYHRQKVPVVKPLVAALAEAGVLVPVQVESWREPAWLHPGAAMPRRVNASALLSPFDSLCWERDRVERVFGFHYRIEIYVPQPKRQYGYYVLPFLHGDQLVARVDLKADRANRTLLVPGVFGEPGIPISEVSAALARELQEMAGWLGLERVEIGRRGDLADPVRTELKGAGASAEPFGLVEPVGSAGGEP